MELRFHKRVQIDLDETLSRHSEISNRLGEDFFAEFQIGLRRVASENISELRQEQYMRHRISGLIQPARSGDV